MKWGIFRAESCHRHEPAGHFHHHGISASVAVPSCEVVLNVVLQRNTEVVLTQVTGSALNPTIKRS